MDLNRFVSVIRWSTVVIAVILAALALMLLTVTARAHPGHKITICHVPPGNPDNPQTIDIDRHAWEAGHTPHNKHSLDYEGECDVEEPDPPPNGNGEGPGPSSVVVVPDCNRTLTGRVTDGESQPIAGITVVLDGHSEQLTDSNGEYLWEWVPVGEHSVTVLFEGTPYFFLEPTQTVTIEECGITYVDDHVDPPPPVTEGWGIGEWFKAGLALYFMGSWSYLLLDRRSA